MNIIDAIHDPNLFRPFFRDLATWSSWLAILKAIFALPMEPAEVEVYRRLSGRQNSPARQFMEVVIEAGRRAGKSFIVSMIAVFAACFIKYSDVLARGERGVVMLVASDQTTAKILMRYMLAFLEAIPMLSRLIERKTADTIELSNGISIEVRAASFRTVRGRTIVCCICDEVAFWRDENSANPAAEILNAIRPGMASVPGALLLIISTCYSPSGALWELDRKYYGQEDEDVLVVRGDTRTMNPTIRRSIVDRAFEEDAAVAWSEYGRDGEIRFRNDLEQLIARAVLDRAVVSGRVERPPEGGVRYSAFMDPAGGGADFFAVAIAHNEKGKAVLDLVRERKGSPETIIAEYAQTLKSYRISSATGDKYSAQFMVEAAARHGIRYEHSARSRSEIYLELMPLLNSGRAELLDNGRLIGQLSSLERRTGRSGKDSIDAPRNAHEDLANAAAGALILVSQSAVVPGFFFVDTKISSRSDAWGNAEDIDD